MNSSLLKLLALRELWAGWCFPSLTAGLSPSHKLQLTRQYLDNTLAIASSFFVFNSPLHCVGQQPPSSRLDDGTVARPALAPSAAQPPTTATFASSMPRVARAAWAPAFFAGSVDSPKPSATAAIFKRSRRCTASSLYEPSRHHAASDFTPLNSRTALSIATMFSVGVNACIL